MGRDNVYVALFCRFSATSSSAESVFSWLSPIWMLNISTEITKAIKKNNYLWTAFKNCIHLTPCLVHGKVLNHLKPNWSFRILRISGSRAACWFLLDRFFMIPYDSYWCLNMPDDSFISGHHSTGAAFLLRMKSDTSLTKWRKPARVGGVRPNCCSMVVNSLWTASPNATRPLMFLYLRVWFTTKWYCLL